MNPSWTFARMGGSPWPKGFVPNAEDPFEDLNEYLGWLYQFPIHLQIFIEDQPEEVREDLKFLAQDGIEHYHRLRNGVMPMAHQKAMDLVLYTISI